MRVRVPDYFDGFSCLAGTVPIAAALGGRWSWTRTRSGGISSFREPWASGSGMRWPWTERMSAFRWTAAAVPF